MRSKLILALTLIAFSLSIHAQSGWVRQQDGYFVQLSASSFESTDYYDINGTLVQNGDKFSSENILFYAEYGAFDRFTFLFNIPILKFQRYNYTQTVSGVGDLRTGFKYAISKSLPISLSFEVEVPTGKDMLIAPSNTNNRASIDLPTGDGEFNFWTTFALSKSTSDGTYYGSAYGTFNYRTKGYSNQMLIGGEIGGLFFDKLWLIGKLSTFNSLGSSSNDNASFLFNEGTKYTSYGLTAFYSITSQFKLTAAFQDYSGILTKMKNISDGPTFTIGFAWEH